MLLRPGRAAVFGVLIVLCACGVATAAGPSLRSYLLRPGEQPGYKVAKHSTRTQHTAAAYVKFEGLGFYGPRGKFAKRLKELGFVAATSEILYGAKKRQGASEVAEFSKPKGAGLLAKFSYESAVSLIKPFIGKGVRLNRFALPAIPKSSGVILRAKPEAVAEVFWVEGDCMLFSVQALPHGSGLTPRQIASRLIAGAESQHARTGGKCGPTAATFTG